MFAMILDKAPQRKRIVEHLCLFPWLMVCPWLKLGSSPLKDWGKGRRGWNNPSVLLEGWSGAHYSPPLTQTASIPFPADTGMAHAIRHHRTETALDNPSRDEHIPAYFSCVISSLFEQNCPTLCTVGWSFCFHLPSCLCLGFPLSRQEFQVITIFTDFQ